MLLCPWMSWNPLKLWARTDCSPLKPWVKELFSPWNCSVRYCHSGSKPTIDTLKLSLLRKYSPPKFIQRRVYSFVMSAIAKESHRLANWNNRSWLSHKTCPCLVSDHALLVFPFCVWVSTFSSWECSSCELQPTLTGSFWHYYPCSGPDSKWNPFWSRSGLETPHWIGSIHNEFMSEGISIFWVFIPCQALNLTSHSFLCCLKSIFWAIQEPSQMTSV